MIPTDMRNASSWKGHQWVDGTQSEAGGQRESGGEDGAGRGMVDSIACPRGCDPATSQMLPTTMLQSEPKASSRTASANGTS